MVGNTMISILAIVLPALVIFAGIVLMAKISDPDWRLFRSRKAAHKHQGQENPGVWA
jgi:hypothetical protein